MVIFNKLHLIYIHLYDFLFLNVNIYNVQEFVSFQLYGNVVKMLTCNLKYVKEKLLEINLESVWIEMFEDRCCIALSNC